MTRAETERVVGEVIARYDHQIGAIVTQDDGALLRLLSTLQCDAADEEIGEYLCSFLVA